MSRAFFGSAGIPFASHTENGFFPSGSEVEESGIFQTLCWRESNTARLPLRPWLKSTAHSLRSGWALADPTNRHRTRLVLEGLEDRCLLSVDLLVTSSNSNSVLRYDSTTGAFIDAFVPEGSGGLDSPIGLTFGPDHNLYVSSENNSSVKRYDGQTGAFIDAFVSSESGGLDHPTTDVFGPDQNLYVASAFNNRVLRYNGTTGAFIDNFVPPGSGGLVHPATAIFGPDGNLYVTSQIGNSILRYNGQTGTFIDAFIPPGSGGLSSPIDMVFGANGNLYVTSLDNNSVLRYNGQTGAFIDAFVTPGSGGLDFPLGLAFGPDRNLYVSSAGNDSVLRYDGTTGDFIDTFVLPESGGLLRPERLLFYTVATAPTVTCSVAQALLWPPNHRLVNVGLGVTIDPPDANLHILVFADDNAGPADAADIGPGTLQLRAERQGGGNGRVYLIVATAANPGGTSFDVCDVAVPHDHSPRSIASVRQQAADAAAYYQEFQTAPPGYHLLGEGLEGGGAPSSGRSGRSALPGDIFQLNAPALATLLASPKQSFLWSIGDAAVPAETLLSPSALLPVDRYFAATHTEGFRVTTPRLDRAEWNEGNGLGFNLVLMDDRLVG